MTINLKKDSDNNVHQIWAQRQPMSCGVASIWMARSMAYRMSFAETEWQRAWRMYHNVIAETPGPLLPETPAPMSFHTQSHLRSSNDRGDQSTFGRTFSTFGTLGDQVTKALKNDKLRVAHTFWSPFTAVDPNRLAEAKPAILLLGWYPNGFQRGAPQNGRAGGHFIVAARKTTTRTIVYLDPWGGQLKEVGYGHSYPGGGIGEWVAYISK